jgi:hypothetical protein
LFLLIAEVIEVLAADLAHRGIAGSVPTPRFGGQIALLELVEEPRHLLHA